MPVVLMGYGGENKTSEATAKKNLSKQAEMCFRKIYSDVK